MSFNARANVGTVLFAIGKTSVERPLVSVLKKGDIVLVGDTIVTGDKSRVQLKMSDGARLSIRPNSKLNIENYLFTKSSSGAATASTSALNLLKGGFRTITGAISSGQNKSGYKVKTAVATIGIRGTDYSVLLCQSDCQPLEASTKTQIDNGLYAGVSQGAIVLLNKAGELQLNVSESGYVASIDTLPIKLLGPPSSLFGQTVPVKESQTKEEPENVTLLSEVKVSSPKPMVTKANTAIAKNEQGFEEEVIISQVVTDSSGNEIIIDNGIIDTKNKSLAISLASQNTTQLIFNDPDSLTFDNQSNLTGFILNQQAVNIGTAQNLNTGFDSVTGFRWGRWSNGFTSSVSGDSIDLSDQSLHWVNNDSFNSSIALPQSGQAQYALTGNTDPTNNLGNTGILGTADFSANFTNQTVSSRILLGINNQVWHANGTGSIALGLNQFNGNYNSVLIDGSEDGSGSFSGFFSNMFNDLQIPEGAGMTYYLQNNSGTQQVTGSLIFGKALQVPR
ncbi:FecR family protein [Pseudoalteromonas denitrificans DSM 6059]|uniref:FecR family protein n=2 Tax=Pseudoalteromonas TaxID=53246 RepID=A0A1I1FQS9_9GAMM|nr:FecR family protein [Pseudoalteromonas denitrificans DSM 6059]